MCVVHGGGYPRAMLRYALATALLSFASQAAADPYTVGGVPVDARAATAIQAQTDAILDGQTRAANRLVERLTYADERQAKAVAPLTSEQATRMIRAMSVANEQRSADRYIGDITVAFVPSRVREYIQSAGLALVDSETRTRAVIPVDNGRVVGPEHPWALALANPSLGHALTPLKLADLDTLSGRVDLTSLARGNVEAAEEAARLTGSQQFLIADYSGGAVSLTDIAADTGTSRSAGRVNGRGYDGAARAIVSRLEAEWKEQNRRIADTGTQTVRAVTLLYGNLSDWQALQEALAGSSRVRGTRIQAISKSGALVDLSHMGEVEALAQELRAKGVTLERHPAYGLIARRTSYRVPAG